MTGLFVFLLFFFSIIVQCFVAAYMANKVVHNPCSNKCANVRGGTKCLVMSTVEPRGSRSVGRFGGRSYLEYANSIDAATAGAVDI